MFDTMTMTKVLGGFCGTFLVFLLGGFAAESIYYSGGGYGAKQAYVIETGNDEPAEEVIEIPFAEVFASADAGAGERLWRQCSACHKLEDGANGTGPHLYNVVGRDKGGVDGFSYSSILTELDGDWTPENLDGFLKNPKDYAPGTKMSYRGLSDVEDRANLIAYLQTIGG